MIIDSALRFVRKQATAAVGLFAPSEDLSGDSSTSHIFDSLPRIPLPSDQPPIASTLWTGKPASFISTDHFSSRVLKPETALTLINNHEHLETLDPVKPLAVVVYPTADHNGAFEANSFPLLDTLVDSRKFHVLYYEAKTPEDVQKILSRVVERSGQKVHTLILGGHGNSTSLALGTDNCSMEADKCLSPKSFTSGDERNTNGLLTLDPYLSEHGQVVLDSCSTGAGGIEDPENLANSVALSLPGRKVYAAEASGNYTSFSVKKDLSLDITWREKGGKTAKMYVATAKDLYENVHQKQSIELQEQEHKRLELQWTLNQINPGTLEKGAPYLSFCRSMGFKEIARTEITYHDEKELAKAVRQKIDAFVQRHGPPWTTGAVFEYLCGYLGPKAAADCHAIYTFGLPAATTSRASGIYHLYLPSETSAKAFPKWINLPKGISRGDN